MSTHQRYVVKKGDCLWDIAERLLGSPWEFERIYQYNNRESIKS
jgi:nucleoid-associated protein YgaU